MTCFSPKVAFWYSPEYLESKPFGLERPIFLGDWKGLKFDYSVALHCNPLLKPFLRQYLIPCGKCEGCRIANLQQWAFRAKSELDQHEVSAFITLTCSDDKLPLVFPDGKLQHRPFQLFMKRFRRWLDDWCDKRKISRIKVRYIMCGEYGTNTFRPHYHVIIFGWFPCDYQLFEYNGKYATYISPALYDLWTDPDDDKSLGFHTVAVANDATIRYLVGYVMKKCDGKYPKDAPPYLRVSTRPAIGLDWLKRYQSEIFAHDGLFFPNDYVFYGSSKQSVPRYFVKKYLESANNSDSVLLRQSRLQAFADRPPVDKCDLDRELDFLRQVTKASHNKRVNEV